MSDTLRVSNLHFGNAASNYNQPQMGFTSVGIGSTANYGFLQFFGTSNTLCWTANGTVGIGTTAPGHSLDVVGETRIGYSSSTDFLVHLGRSGVGSYRSAYIYGNSNNMEINNQQNGAFILSTNNAERMRITSNGSVGIGTNAPGSTFEVYTNGGIGGTTQMNVTSFAGTGTLTNTSVLNLRIQGAGGGMVDNSISAQYNSSGEGTYSLAFKPFGTTAMTILGTGNVGIGTAAPGVALDVNGTINTRTTFTLSDAYPATNGLIRMTTAFGVNYIQSGLTTALDSKADLVFGSINAGTEWLRIKSNGNIGINVGNPIEKLHIFHNPTNVIRLQTSSVDNAYIVAAYDFLSISANHSSTGTRENTGRGSSQIVLQSPGAGGLITFNTNPSINTGLLERMRITANGDVGIGVASPDVKLHVAGGLRATAPVYSWATSFYYYSGNETWNAGNVSTEWPMSGNVFLITMTGPVSLAGNAVRGFYIMVHSRNGAGGNNSYGIITPILSPQWIPSNAIGDHFVTFTFNSPIAQDVQIRFLALA